MAGAVGRTLHVKAQEHDPRRAPQVREVDRLEAAVAAPVEVLSSEACFALALDPVEPELLRRLDVLRPELGAVRPQFLDVRPPARVLRAPPVRVAPVDGVGTGEEPVVVLDGDAPPAALALAGSDDFAVGKSEAWAAGNDDSGSAGPPVPLSAFFSTGPAGLVSLGPTIGAARPCVISWRARTGSTTIFAPSGTAPPPKSSDSAPR